MTKKQMMDGVIRKFGFEDYRTINFIRYAESPAYVNHTAKYFYEILMEIDPSEKK